MVWERSKRGHFCQPGKAISQQRRWTKTQFIFHLQCSLKITPQAVWYPRETNNKSHDGRDPNDAHSHLPAGWNSRPTQWKGGPPFRSSQPHRGIIAELPNQSARTEEATWMRGETSSRTLSSPVAYDKPSYVYVKTKQYQSLRTLKDGCLAVACRVLWCMWFPQPVIKLKAQWYTVSNLFLFKIELCFSCFQLKGSLNWYFFWHHAIDQRDPCSRVTETQQLSVYNT